MWDLIVSVPDHCLSFYFVYVFESLISDGRSSHNDYLILEDINEL